MNAKVTPWALFGAWLQIGLQSFGGGQSTLALIQRKLGAQNGWITAADFTRANAMAQMAPGINLLAIAILIGRRLAGRVGVLVSLAGLLVPSIAVTVLMTAGYAVVRQDAAVQHAFHGIIPATVGIGTLTALTMAQSLLKPGKQMGDIRDALCGLAVIAISFMALREHAPVIAVLLGGGAAMGVVHAGVAALSSKTCTKENA